MTETAISFFRDLAGLDSASSHSVRRPRGSESATRLLRGRWVRLFAFANQRTHSAPGPDLGVRRSRGPVTSNSELRSGARA